MNHNTYQWTDFVKADKVNGKFILSGDIKATGSGSTSSAVINIYWYDAGKNSIGDPTSYFNVKDGEWQRYTPMDIDPPANTAYARIMAITYQGYTGYFDNLQFEQSPQIRGYNFLQNSSFVNGITKRTKSSGYADVLAEEGVINLPSTGSTYLESQTAIPVKQNKDYTLSGNLTTEQITAASGYGATLQVLIYNDSGTLIETFKSKVVSENSKMAKYVVPFRSSVNGTAKVRLDMTGAKGIAKFDNIRFGYGREAVTSTYDVKSNYVENTTNQLGKTVSYINLSPLYNGKSGTENIATWTSIITNPVFFISFIFPTAFIMLSSFLVLSCNFKMPLTPQAP